MTRGVADVGATMAIDALHSQLHVRVVRECDGLFRQSRDRADSYERQGSGAISKQRLSRLTMKQSISPQPLWGA